MTTPTDLVEQICEAYAVQLAIERGVFHNLWFVAALDGKRQATLATSVDGSLIVCLQEIQRRLEEQ